MSLACQTLAFRLDGIVSCHWWRGRTTRHQFVVRYDGEEEKSRCASASTSWAKHAHAVILHAPAKPNWPKHDDANAWHDAWHDARHDAADAAVTDNDARHGRHAKHDDAQAAR